MQGFPQKKSAEESSSAEMELVDFYKAAAAFGGNTDMPKPGSFSYEPGFWDCLGIGKHFRKEMLHLRVNAYDIVFFRNFHIFRTHFVS